MSNAPNPTQNVDLKSVISFTQSGLVLMQNSYAALNLAKKTPKDFTGSFPGQLGQTAQFEMPIRASSSYGLQADFKGVSMRPFQITVTQAANASFAYNDIQALFSIDVRNFRTSIAASYVAELGAKIEVDLMREFVSSVKYLSSAPGSVIEGTFKTNSGPYRFYGDGFTDISTYTKFAEAYRLFINRGHSKGKRIKMIIPDSVQPQVVGSGLAEFVPKRNDETASSWEIGSFTGTMVDVYTSNIMPHHIAGNVGNQQEVADRQLTLISTNKEANNGIITQLTLSGATANDANAIKRSDLGSFINNTVFLGTQVGDAISRSPVQIRALSDAAADASGNVVIDIAPGLTTDRELGQTLADLEYISADLVAGMKLQMVGSHTAGIIFEEDALMCAMPTLPSAAPFQNNIATSVTDPDTGAGMRLSSGYLLKDGLHGVRYDAIWGSHLIPERSMRMIFPSQSAAFT